MVGRVRSWVSLVAVAAAALLAVVAMSRPGRHAPEPTWMGMEIEALTPDFRTSLGLAPDQAGVIVSDVVGLAQQAGVREGDVVVALGGRPTPNLDAFRAAVSAAAAQPQVRLDFIRNRSWYSLALPPGVPNAGTLPVLTPCPSGNGWCPAAPAGAR
jgi:S1-C subfamily serine protease